MIGVIMAAHDIVDHMHRVYENSIRLLLIIGYPVCVCACVWVRVFGLCINESHTSEKIWGKRHPPPGGIADRIDLFLSKFGASSVRFAIIQIASKQKKNNHNNNTTKKHRFWFEIVCFAIHTVCMDAVNLIRSLCCVRPLVSFLQCYLFFSNFWFTLSQRTEITSFVCVAMCVRFDSIFCFVRHFKIAVVCMERRYISMRVYCVYTCEHLHTRGSHSYVWSEIIFSKQRKAWKGRS